MVTETEREPTGEEQELVAEEATEQNESEGDGDAEEEEESEEE